MTKGIFIASLNSDALVRSIERKEDLQFINTVEELDVFVFDTLEVLNGIFFAPSDAGQQRDFIEIIIEKLSADFIAGERNRRLIRCSEIRGKLNPIIGRVFNEYYSNPKFEKHCKNQIFNNLQPKLRRIGIHKNKSSLIEVLIPFLIVEIALYLFIYTQGSYSRIFGLEEEMEIIVSIRSGKYSAFESDVARPVYYSKI